MTFFTSAKIEYFREQPLRILTLGYNTKDDKAHVVARFRYLEGCSAFLAKLFGQAIEIEHKGTKYTINKKTLQDYLITKAGLETTSVTPRIRSAVQRAFRNLASEIKDGERTTKSKQYGKLLITHIIRQDVEKQMRNPKVSQPQAINRQSITKNATWKVFFENFINPSNECNSTINTNVVNPPSPTTVVAIPPEDTKLTRILRTLGKGVSESLFLASPEAKRVFANQLEFLKKTQVILNQQAPRYDEIEQDLEKLAKEKEEFETKQQEILTSIEPPLLREKDALEQQIEILDSEVEELEKGVIQNDAKVIDKAKQWFAKGPLKLSHGVKKGRILNVSQSFDQKKLELKEKKKKLLELNKDLNGYRDFKTHISQEILKLDNSKSHFEKELNEKKNTHATSLINQLETSHSDGRGGMPFLANELTAIGNATDKFKALESLKEKIDKTLELNLKYLSELNRLLNQDKFNVVIHQYHSLYEKDEYIPELTFSPICGLITEAGKAIFKNPFKPDYSSTYRGHLDHFGRPPSPDVAQNSGRTTPEST